MTSIIHIEKLTADAFAPFGDLIDTAGEPTKLINNGLCERFNDRVRLDFDDTGRVGVSVLYGKPYALPYTFSLVERHPLGSQAFIPMIDAPFLVIVAQDENGVPGTPLAFLTAHCQGVNIHRNTWHGILTPLEQTTPFAVVDWIGDNPNLEEYHYPSPWQVSTKA